MRCYGYFLIALLLAGGEAAAQQNAGALMKSVIIPASDAVFAVGKKAPGTDEQWRVVRESAERLAVSAPTLAGMAPADSGANWSRYAGAMGAAAKQAAAVARDKNADGVLDAGDALYVTCEDCHKQYMKR